MPFKVSQVLSVFNKTLGICNRKTCQFKRSPFLSVSNKTLGLYDTDMPFKLFILCPFISSKKHSPFSALLFPQLLFLPPPPNHNPPPLVYSNTSITDAVADIAEPHTRQDRKGLASQLTCRPTRMGLVRVPSGSTACTWGTTVEDRTPPS